MTNASLWGSLIALPGNIGISCNCPSISCISWDNICWVGSTSICWCNCNCIFWTNCLSYIINDWCWFYNNHHIISSWTSIWCNRVYISHINCSIGSISKCFTNISSSCSGSLRNSCNCWSWPSYNRISSCSNSWACSSISKCCSTTNIRRS